VSNVQVDGATTIYAQAVTTGAANVTLMQLRQSFTFHDQPVQGQFAGRGFRIGASTLKWSLTLTGSSSSAAGGLLTVRYRLSEAVGSASVMANPACCVTVRHDVPQAQMTTYYVPFESAVSVTGGELSSHLVALEEVWTWRWPMASSDLWDTT
jgi:hypothetical protein